MHATFNERKSDIAYKYNNTVHRTIKMKPIILLLNTMKNQIKKPLNLRLVVMKEFLSTEISLLKDMILIGQKKFLLLVKLIIQFRGLMLLVT